MPDALVRVLTPTRQRIELAALVPNAWNPNAQRPRNYEALRESVRDHGDIDPILCRPHPDQPECYQIIDGEHRWRALRDEGFHDALCDIVECDTPQAKKLTIILNETRGEADRLELAELLVELEADFGAGLRSGLPFSDDELADQLALGRVEWDGLHVGAGAGVALGGEADGDEARTAMTFALTQAQRDVVQQALGRARAVAGDVTLSDGRSLELLCADYLAGPAPAEESDAYTANT